MKDLKRILAFVLTLIMMTSAVAFAAGTDKVTVSIVSPAANTVSTSDSLVISVKVNNPGKVKISVYEQSIKKVEILSTGSAAEGNLATYASVSYSSVDTTSFAATDFTSNPALETYVSRTYVNPVVYDSTEKIGFYTKQLYDVKPGLYKVTAEVLDKDNKTVETVSSLIAVKAKPQAEEPAVFEQKQSGALKILQNLLKTIFK